MTTNDKHIKHQILEEMFRRIGNKTAIDTANEIIGVQPMPSNIIKDLINESKSEKELKDEGYSPVSNLGLMWVKKGNEDGQ
jgi:hypothetical protein